MPTIFGGTKKNMGKRHDAICDGTGAWVRSTEEAHVARRIDAAKMHGGHGASLEIVA
jgi:hypothetical protein